MSEGDHVAAHRPSIRHRHEVEASKSCGCFSCLATFEPAAIEEWLDEGDRTALCPQCGIDSGIASASGYEITREFLDRTHRPGFSNHRGSSVIRRGRLFMFQWLTAKARRWRVKTLKPFGPSTPTAGPRLSLGDRAPGVARALADAFADADAVEVVEGNLLDLDCDGVVSPANSFGDMGGGIDKAIDDLHEGKAQAAVMDAIARRFLGELPVGMALVVELSGPRLPFVVAAPTMRVAGTVAGTINAYLAMRAALVAVLLNGKPIRRLAVPGLCTGVGGIHPAEAADQMRAAFDNVAGGRWRQVLSPAQAPYALRRPTA
jgi:O-acetyl-ADP-ribose deacetylase (regulator of RNase III)